MFVGTFVFYSGEGGVCLHGQQFPVFFLCVCVLSFFSAAFPLGGASIMISEHPDAFGVFECPHLYWASKILNFVPCNLIKISTRDFIKAAMGLCS